MPNIYPNSQPQPYYGVNGKLTDDAKALPVPKKVFILEHMFAADGVRIQA